MSILHYLLFFTLILSGCSVDDTPHIAQLKKEAQKKETHEGVIYKDVVYKKTLFHDVKLDIYEPLVQTQKTAPIYLYIHGGSWLRGNKNLVNIYDKTMHTLRENGIAVVSIDYRFISQSGISSMIEDCLDAVAFLRKNAKKYNLDTHHIGVHGHSAGANLALIVGATLSKSSDDILFIVDEYGPIDIEKLIQEKKHTPWWSHLISTEELKSLSPVYLLHSKLPPIYIAHGDSDTMVPLEQSKELYTQLQKLHIKSSLHIIKDANHGYRGIAKFKIKEHRKEVLEFMLQYFNKQLDNVRYEGNI